jgi:cyclic pyranopterin phosphate synthase
MAGGELVDPHGRKIRKLRLSLTDQCNFRCRYCMPQQAEFMDCSDYLDSRAYAEIVGELLELGITEVRLTGGEPLLRKEFAVILKDIAKLGVPKLSLTTNGSLLHHYFDILKECHVQHINISLDTLRPATLQAISYHRGLAQIIANIHRAVNLNFVVKLNTVVLAGINDDELITLVEFAKQQGVAIRFLELMQIGYGRHLYPEHFIATATILNRLRQHYVLSPLETEPDSTAFYFRTNCGAVIGFIASESQPFCGNCSRWRLTADGRLFPCLFAETGIPLKGLTPTARQKVYQQVLGMKPLRRSPQVSHLMHSIGG